jgi:hypothetical protein
MEKRHACSWWKKKLFILDFNGLFAGINQDKATLTCHMESSEASKVKLLRILPLVKSFFFVVSVVLLCVPDHMDYGLILL